MAIVHGRPSQTLSRRYAAGIIALRPDSRRAHLAATTASTTSTARSGGAIIDSHLPPPGTPTQPVDAGYMANAWLRMKHPDYDDAPPHARHRRADGQGPSRRERPEAIARTGALRMRGVGSRPPRRLTHADLKVTLVTLLGRSASSRRSRAPARRRRADRDRHRRLAGARGRRRRARPRALGGRAVNLASPRARRGGLRRPTPSSRTPTASARSGSCSSRTSTASASSTRSSRRRAAVARRAPTPASSPRRQQRVDRRSVRAHRRAAPGPLRARSRRVRRPRWAPPRARRGREAPRRDRRRRHRGCDGHRHRRRPRRVAAQPAAALRRSRTLVDAPAHPRVVRRGDGGLPSASSSSTTRRRRAPASREVLDAGLGLVQGVVALPAAAPAAPLDDRESVELLRAALRARRLRRARRRRARHFDGTASSTGRDRDDVRLRRLGSRSTPRAAASSTRRSVAR